MLSKNAPSFYKYGTQNVEKSVWYFTEIRDISKKMHDSSTKMRDTSTKSVIIPQIVQIFGE